MSLLPTFPPSVRLVTSFEELVSTPFGGGVNALCWPRRLEGDFAEIVAQVGAVDEITTLDEEDLMSLHLSAAGRAARTAVLADLRRLQAHELDPSLDVIPGYPQADGPELVPTDVYSWHADSAPVIADTYLCSYAEAASQGLRPEDALRCVDVPATRAALLSEYGGSDDAGFAAFLRENCYDLHYEAVAGAQAFDFGFGNLWRIANLCPGSPVPPCVHRAPATIPGRPPRLLLIS